VKNQVLASESTVSYGVTTAMGFDPLQSIALEHSFRGLPSEAFSFYRLTPRNFESIVAQLNQDYEAKPEVKQLLVTAVPTLTFLGLTPESFPAQTLFITYEEFVEHFITSVNGVKINALATLPTEQVEKFFHSGGLSKSQVSLLLLIALGHTNIEIAKRMTLTEKGVESAIKRLAIKLDCSREGSRPHNLRILLGRRYAQLLGVL
jgi:DNA-binding CsgD family transcriptional regulator